jgi:hypothetical protein
MTDTEKRIQRVALLARTKQRDEKTQRRTAIVGRVAYCDALKKFVAIPARP